MRRNRTMKTVILTIAVDFDPDVTNAEAIANSLDLMMCGSFDDLNNEHGPLVVREFQALETPEDFE